MSEQVEIFARKLKDINTPANIGADMGVFSNVKIPVGNMPVGYGVFEGLTLIQIIEILSKISDKYFEPIQQEEFEARLAELMSEFEDKIDDIIAQGFYKTYPTQVALLAAKPTAEFMYAKALDTGKVWLWNRTSAAGVTPVTGVWTDTGSSELDKAKLYTDEKTKMLRMTASKALFTFEDKDKNAVILFLEDGDIESSKFGKLSKIAEPILGEAKLYTDEKTKFFNQNIADSLFEFKDKDDSIVVQIRADGDLVLAALEEGTVSQLIKLLLSVSAKATDSPSIFELRDSDDNLIFDFTSEGDIIFNGGESLKKITATNEKVTSVKIPSRYELITEEFNSILTNYRNLSHISDLPIPIGLCNQKYKISDKQAFLNLKITQPERIKVDSPYYLDDQVVHPFLCNFYKTFRGFKHVLLLTPYNSTNSIFENPCVYGSNDLLNFELLPDMPQPIYERYPDDYNYNSDNFAIYDHTTGEFCVAWRNGTTQSGFDLWLSKTSDGVHWSERQQLIPKTAELILSPNVLYNPKLNKWVMYSISNDIIHEAFTGNKFNYRLADDLSGNWSEPVFIDTPFTSWHQEVRYCGDQFVTIINDQKFTGQLYLGISDDGITWEFKNVGMIEGTHLNSYKASIVPNVINDSVEFDIFWTSSNVANGENLWQLFHTKTQPIQIEGI